MFKNVPVEIAPVSDPQFPVPKDISEHQGYKNRRQSFRETPTDDSPIIKSLEKRENRLKSIENLDIKRLALDKIRLVEDFLGEKSQREKEKQRDQALLNQRNWLEKEAQEAKQRLIKTQAEIQGQNERISKAQREKEEKERNWFEAQEKEFKIQQEKQRQAQREKEGKEEKERAEKAVRLQERESQERLQAFAITRDKAERERVQKIEQEKELKIQQEKRAQAIAQEIEQDRARNKAKSMENERKRNEKSQKKTQSLQNFTTQQKPVEKKDSFPVPHTKESQPMTPFIPKPVEKKDSFPVPRTKEFQPQFPERRDSLPPVYRYETRGFPVPKEFEYTSRLEQVQSQAPPTLPKPKVWNREEPQVQHVPQATFSRIPIAPIRSQPVQQGRVEEAKLPTTTPQSWQPPTQNKIVIPQGNNPHMEDQPPGHSHVLIEPKNPRKRQHRANETILDLPDPQKRKGDPDEIETIVEKPDEIETIFEKPDIVEKPVEIRAKKSGKKRSGNNSAKAKQKQLESSLASLEEVEAFDLMMENVWEDYQKHEAKMIEETTKVQREILEQEVKDHSWEEYQALNALKIKQIAEESEEQRQMLEDEVKEHGWDEYQRSEAKKKHQIAKESEEQREMLEEEANEDGYDEYQRSEAKKRYQSKKEAQAQREILEEEIKNAQSQNQVEPHLEHEEEEQVELTGSNKGSKGSKKSKKPRIPSERQSSRNKTAPERLVLEMPPPKPKSRTYKARVTEEKEDTRRKSKRKVKKNLQVQPTPEATKKKRKAPKARTEVVERKPKAQSKTKAPSPVEAQIEGVDPDDTLEFTEVGPDELEEEAAREPNMDAWTRLIPEISNVPTRVVSRATRLIPEISNVPTRVVSRAIRRIRANEVVRSRGSKRKQEVENAPDSAFESLKTLQ
jgi:hypothetical protein